MINYNYNFCCNNLNCSTHSYTDNYNCNLCYPLNTTSSHSCGCLNELEKEITYICNHDYNYFLDKPNVIGVGLGYKCINENLTDEKCITVLVDEKIPNDYLTANMLIPSIYKGIPIDILSIGTPILTRSLKDKIRPVIGGCSISNALIDETGTLACLVKDDFGLYILSNNHVLAGLNKAPIGSPITQPGLIDGGSNPNNVIATLSRFVPVQFITSNSAPPNEVDCAIAKVTNSSLVTSSIAIINQPPQGIVFPTLGARVKKVGRTSGLTTGIVRVVNATLRTGNNLYVNQIISTNNTSVGDSGALLLDENNYAMGLIYSKTDENHSISNPISRVLDLLQVSLVTN